jgi:hypothetical protein
MSIAHRDERARIYGYAAGGSDGFPNPTYPFLAERWARFTTVAAGETSPVAQAQHVTEVLVAFAGEVTVPMNGMVKQVSTGRVCKVASVEIVRTASATELQVRAVWVDDRTPALVEVP